VFSSGPLERAAFFFSGKGFVQKTNENENSERREIGKESLQKVTKKTKGEGTGN
jgi:hypothetical protein